MAELPKEQSATVRAPAVAGTFSANLAPSFDLPSSAGGIVRIPAPDDVSLLIFIRGHWCPYCRRYLQKLRQAYPRLIARGAALLVVSPEPVPTSIALAQEFDLPFPIHSDAAGAAIDAYGVRNRFADADTLMPHPAVFVIDRGGVIRFRSIDRDVKRRTTIRTMLGELRKAASDQLEGGSPLPPLQDK